jgi:integrase/recombinase XerD
MPPRKLPKTLTDDEYGRLLAAPNLSVPTGLRDRCLLELMANCGLRVSEVCGLHLRDVDWKEGEIRIRSEVAKGGREAVVYLEPGTQQLLQRWKDARRLFGAGKPHLFVIVRQAQRGEPLNRQRVYEMVRRRSARAGIAWPVHPHALRHTFATRRLAEGFTISEVQRLMRHSRLETTAIYLDVRDVDLRAKVRARR